MVCEYKLLHKGTKMLGRVFLRAGFVVVQDNPATDFDSVRSNLDAAIAILQSGQASDMIFSAGTITVNYSNDDARYLAGYFHSNAPASCRVVIVHHEVDRMISRADAVTDELQTLGRGAYSARTQDEAETWLNGTPVSADKQHGT
jgi:hypothetical protein